NMSLTNPMVSDPSANGLAPVLSGAFNAGDTNTDGKLSVGETWQYTASHTLTQSEIDAYGGGTLENTASVTTDQGATANGSASVAVVQPPPPAVALTIDDNDNLSQLSDPG